MSWRLRLPLAVCLCLAPATAWGQDPDAKQRASDLFDRLGESTAVAWDAGTIRSFERFGGDDALARMIAAYKKGRRAHPAQLRALLADAIARRGLTDPGSLATIQSFFDSLAKNEIHSWGSFRCAQVLAKHGQREALETVLTSDKKWWRRVAVLEALGRSGQTGWLTGLEAWLPGFHKLAGEGRDSVFVSFAWAVARLARAGYTPEPTPKPPAKPAKPAKPVTPPTDPVLKKRWERRERARQERLARRRKVLKEARQKRRAARAAARKITQPAIDAAIALLDAPKLSLTARRKIAKGLQHAFHTDTAPVDASYWRARSAASAKAAPASPVRAPATAVRGARFMSINADGERLLFLLDASDSMLKALTSKEREAFQKLFRPAARKTVERIWKRVKTRFDAARVHLISTLQKLDKKQQFAIVFFGDDPQVCSATRGFARASKKNVRAAVSALQEFLPRPPSPTKPLGSLLGQTNYYGSFFAAFKHSPKGPLKTEHPEVHRGLIRRGADMIFLLSDGAPNQDGLRGQSPQIDRERTIYKATKTGERTVNMDYRDPETGELIKRPPQTIPTYKYTPIKKVKEKYRTSYSRGPYVQDAPFLLEVERLNLVRKVTIHTIALGETRPGLMKAIAARGYGTFVDVTKVK